MSSHGRSEPVSLVTAAAALWVVVLPGCVRAQDDAQAGPQWPAARFAAWEPYAATRCRCVMKASTDARWLAVSEKRGEQRLFSVWALSSSGGLRSHLADSLPAGHGVWDFTWCAGMLVFGEAAGLDRLSTADDAFQHGRTVVWDPSTGQEVGAADEMFLAFLGSAHDTRVAAMTPMSRYTAESRPDACYAKVMQVPDLSGVRELTFAATGEIPLVVSSSITIPAPVCWHPERDGWFMLVLRQQGDRRSMRWTSRFLALWDVEGHAVDVGLVGGRHTPRNDARSLLDIPGVTPVDGGAAVAAYVEGPNRKDSIVIYGPEGQVRSYYLGAGFDGLGYPLKLAKMDEDHIPWQFIAMAPDGRRAVFQKLRGPDTALNAPRDVWCWDMETDTGYHIATIGEIVEYHGWLNDDAVIVGVRNTESEPAEHLLDYGVLWLTRPPAADGEGQ